MENKYKVGKYIRLSLADGDNRESESVENQRDLIGNFISKYDEFSEVYEYVDDGYTGANFDRPDFKRLLEDVKIGKINCIITKDLSRFGRDHIDTGYYLERYFPKMNIRFISINDVIDTKDNKGLQFLSFKLSFNDYYIQDISNKIKSVKKKKMLLGEYQSRVAPYGYKKDTEKKNHLIIDYNVSNIVKEIFEMYAYKNMSTKQIADELTIRQVLVPSLYINDSVWKNNNKKYAENNIWSRSTITSMLKNMTYIGCVVSGKKEQISPKIKKGKNKSKDEYIIVSNMHEPIIDKELWDLVQVKLNSYKHSANKKYDYIFKDLVYCGKCGEKGQFRHHKTIINGKLIWEGNQVQCSNKKERKKCDNSSLSENELLEKIKIVIKQEIDKLDYTNINLNTILKSVRDEKGKNEMNSDKLLKELENKIENIDNEISNIYNDKIERKIALEEFKKKHKVLNQEKTIIEEKIREIKENKFESEEKIKKNKELIKIAKKFLKMDNPNSEILNMLIKKITFYNRKITVELNFKKIN